jgi:hypothetical protein
MRPITVAFVSTSDDNGVELVPFIKIPLANQMATGTGRLNTVLRTSQDSAPVEMPKTRKTQTVFWKMAGLFSRRTPEAGAGF